jgi:hypothetical protein
MNLLESLQMQGFKFSFSGEGYLSCEPTDIRVAKETMDMIAENVKTLSDQLIEQQEKELRLRITA